MFDGVIVLGDSPHGKWWKLGQRHELTAISDTMIHRIDCHDDASQSSVE